MIHLHVHSHYSLLCGANSPAELIERFSLDGVNRSPSRFDWDKCMWLKQAQDYR